MLTLHSRHGFSRRDALKTAAGFAAFAGLPPANAKEPDAGKPKPNAIGGDAALRRLMTGNARYVANKPTHRDFSTRRAERISAQYSDHRDPQLRGFARGARICLRPRARRFLCCSACRQFCQWRWAGQPRIWGEISRRAAGSRAWPLELRRDRCCDQSGDNATLPGHLPELVQSLKPAVEAAKVKSPKDLLAAAITENVALNMKQLETAQPLLARFAETGKVKVAGGVYDLATGKISLLS